MNIRQRVKVLLHPWYSKVLLITILAIIVRSIPAWTNAAWGGDFGIYYGLTTRFVDAPALFSPYDGWGGTYNFFPVLYVVSALSHWATGASILWIMPKVAPVFGGLTVLVFCLLIYKLTRRRDLALLSSLILAVIPLHAYQTSHAAPLTMGHFFMVLTLYFYLQFLEDGRHLVPLAASTVLLVMSHHFTTYFFLITLLALLLWRSISAERRTLQTMVLYTTFASVLTFAYWRFVATPVFDSFMVSGMRLSPTLVLGVFYLILFGWVAAILTLRKHRPSWVQALRDVRLTSHTSHRRRAAVYFAAVFVATLCVEAVFTVVTIPSSGVRLQPISLLYSLPITLLLAFAGSGLEYVSSTKRGWVFQAWFTGLFLSFAYALVSNNHTLYPDRHLEYLIVPISVFAAVGILSFLKAAAQLSRPNLSLRRLVAKPSIELLSIVLVTTVVFSNAIAVYPVYSSLNWMDESIPGPSADALLWMQQNLDPNVTVVATDLRLAKMVWADHFNATYETTNATWTSETWLECWPDLDAGPTRQRITHILIDDVMRDTSVNIRVDETVYMTNASYDKFRNEPFILLFRNATLDDDGQELHWAELYAVNWSFIETVIPFGARQ